MEILGKLIQIQVGTVLKLAHDKLEKSVKARLIEAAHLDVFLLQPFDTAALGWVHYHLAETTPLLENLLDGPHRCIAVESDQSRVVIQHMALVNHKTAHFKRMPLLWCAARDQ